MDNFDSIESVEEIKNIIEFSKNKDIQPIGPPFLKDAAIAFDSLNKETLNFSNISNIQKENEDTKKIDEKNFQINNKNKEFCAVKLNKGLLNKNTRNCDKKNYFYSNENISSFNSYNTNKNKLINKFSFRNGKFTDKIKKKNLHKKKLNLLNDFLEFKCNSINQNKNFANRLFQIKQSPTQISYNNSNNNKYISKRSVTLFNDNTDLNKKSEIFGVNNIDNFKKKNYSLFESNINLDLNTNNNFLFKKIDKKIKNQKYTDLFNSLNNKSKFSSNFILPKKSKNNLSFSINNINDFDIKKLRKLNSESKSSLVKIKIMDKNEKRSIKTNSSISLYNKSYNKDKLVYNSCRKKILTDILSNNQKLSLNNGNSNYSSFRYKKFCVLKSFESDIKESNDFSNINRGPEQKINRYYSGRDSEFRSLNNKILLSY